MSAFLRIERMLIGICAEFKVAATQVAGRSGVWVPADGRGPDRKVAAIGVALLTTYSLAFEAISLVLLPPLQPDARGHHSGKSRGLSAVLRLAHQARLSP